jgi:hypothetical protein
MAGAARGGAGRDTGRRHGGNASVLAARQIAAELLTGWSP